jgi:hypothetical protein
MVLAFGMLFCSGATPLTIAKPQFRDTAATPHVNAIAHPCPDTANATPGTYHPCPDTREANSQRESVVHSCPDEDDALMNYLHPCPEE